MCGAACCGCACIEGGAGCCLACCTMKPPRGVTMYLYGAVFLITTIAAWVSRDFGPRFLQSTSFLVGCGENHDCLGSEGVLRLSFGVAVFFVIMTLTTWGTETEDDPRDTWHHGWWPLKIAVWVCLSGVSFVIPAAFFQAYALVARIGAGLFLVIQLVSILNFAYVWNDNWVARKRCAFPTILVTVCCYLLCFAGVVVMYLWFAPNRGCGFNIFLITLGLGIALTVSGISLLQKVEAGLLISSLMSVYILYLTYSAIMSEPEGYGCNTRERQTGRTDWVVVVSFVLGCLSVVMATLFTGIDSHCFKIHPKKAGGDGGGAVPYGYGFFHLVFALGCMYMAMVLIGWNLNQTQVEWSVNTGWTSVWIQVAASWLAALMYLWTLVAPLLFPDRHFSGAGIEMSNPSDMRGDA